MSGSEPRPTRSWLAVVPRNRAATGKRIGIVMVNHGKGAPLRRMRPVDSIVPCSPKAAYREKEPLTQFTAIARVRGRGLLA